MARIKQLGIVVVASLMLLNGSVPSDAWAQGTQPTKNEPSTAQQVTAVFTNILYVPLKGLVLCPVSGGLWVATIVVSGGTHYNSAANLVKGGCGGKWIVKGEDIHFAP